MVEMCGDLWCGLTGVIHAAVAEDCESSLYNNQSLVINKYLAQSLLCWVVLPTYLLGPNMTNWQIML